MILFINFPNFLRNKSIKCIAFKNQNQMYSENVYFPSINNTIWIIHWNNTNRISHCVFLCITSFIYGNLWPAIILWHCLSVFYRNKGQLDLTFVLKYLSHSLFIFRGNFFGIFPIKKMTKRKSNRKKKQEEGQRKTRAYLPCVTRVTMSIRLSICP